MSAQEREGQRARQPRPDVCDCVSRAAQPQPECRSAIERCAGPAPVDEPRERAERGARLRPHAVRAPPWEAPGQARPAWRAVGGAVRLRGRGLPGNRGFLGGGVKLLWARR